MSVAISPYLPAQASLFGNQHTDLLEALLESCQKSANNPRLPGYGRDLKPYFDPASSQFLPPVKGNSAPSTQKISGKGKNRKSFGVEHISGSSASGSDEEAQKKTVKRGAGKRGASPKPIQNDSKANVSIVKAQRKSASGITWAGPAFGVAPAPHEMPMPSGFLLE